MTTKKESTKIEITKVIKEACANNLGLALFVCFLISFLYILTINIYTGVFLFIIVYIDIKCFCEIYEIRKRGEQKMKEEMKK